MSWRFGSRILSFQFEVGADQFAALGFQHAAGGDFTTVIDPFELIEIGGAAQAPHLGVRHSVYHPLQARHERGAGAHGAGLLGDVERAVFEPPVADGSSSLGDGEHFGVGGGVFTVFDRVVGRGNDLSIAHDHATDGDFILTPGVDRLVKSEAHKELVIAH